ncbi:MAG: response regulator [Armatimonadota bacterium]|nr:MAG: response regulator [Armatimonadota bacterium]
MGKRVLVVDDHQPTVKLIEDALTRAGFSVLTAGNGLECLRKAEAEPPDLVILDVIMPRMNGIQALRKLRERPQTRDVPVIILTVRQERGDVLAGWSAGANIYISKPCKMELLVATVKRLLGVPAQF